MSEVSYCYTDRQRPLQDCDSDNDRVMADGGEERDMSVYPSGASTPQSKSLHDITHCRIRLLVMYSLGY